jgi:hypothetical protein
MESELAVDMDSLVPFSRWLTWLDRSDEPAEM